MPVLFLDPIILSVDKRSRKPVATRDLCLHLPASPHSKKEGEEENEEEDD